MHHVMLQVDVVPERADVENSRVVVARRSFVLVVAFGVPFPQHLQLLPTQPTTSCPSCGCMFRVTVVEAPSENLRKSVHSSSCT